MEALFQERIRLGGRELEQTPGDSEGEGGLACCSPWGCKESERTQWLNNNKIVFVTQEATLEVIPERFSESIWQMIT